MKKKGSPGSSISCMICSVDVLIIMPLVELWGDDVTVIELSQQVINLCEF